MLLKFKKIHPDAKTPSYANSQDAGLDLYSIDDMTIQKGQRCLVHTGIVIELPPNTEAQIRPKSGLALNFGITVLNTPGTIDEGYRGEIGVILINLGEKEYHVKPGDKIAQMVIKRTLNIEIEEGESIYLQTERSNGGFGSSGLD